MKLAYFEININNFKDVRSKLGTLPIRDIQKNILIIIDSYIHCFNITIINKKIVTN